MFEDPVTDARMRRTIPEFAVLGAVAVAATAPFAASGVTERLAIVGAAAVAALSAVVLRTGNLIGRLTRPMLFVLLVAYCVLISIAVAVTDDPATPYRFIYLVPVLFTAVFFTSWGRYALAVLAPLLQSAIGGVTITFSASHIAVQIVAFLFVAHFGAVVADTLRGSLRSTRALHTVLEAASGSPLDADIGSIGLDAALAVLGWEAGAVLLPDGDLLRMAAARLVDPELEHAYAGNPIRLDNRHHGAVEVLQTQKPLVLSNASAHSRYPILAMAGFRSVVALPLVHHGVSIGVLVVADSAGRQIDDMVWDRLNHVARQLGLAMGSAGAFRQATEVNARLGELNRRKDEFLANVSHELRTPAATIKLIAATLRSAGTKLTDEQRAEMYDTLERRAAHLAQLIEDLLHQAVTEAGGSRLTVTEIDWSDSVCRWAEIAELQTGREITMHLPDGRVVGTGDAVKLERVVANLLSNAAKFSEPGTPIELRLRVVDDDVEVEVCDRGVGIAADELDHIFERFRQVEAGATRSAGGFGIGLSLVRNFVEAHGGTVGVDSTPGEGTRFTVRVPLHQPTP
jgi:signal transduction histidine kinase